MQGFASTLIFPNAQVCTPGHHDFRVYFCIAYLRASKLHPLTLVDIPRLSVLASEKLVIFARTFWWRHDYTGTVNYAQTHTCRSDAAETPKIMGALTGPRILSVPEKQRGTET